MWALFAKIRNTVKTIEERVQFAKTKQGLLIVQGKHVLCGTVMSKEVGLRSWLNLDIERCKTRFLDSHLAWGLPPGADPAAERERLELIEAEHDSELAN